MKVHRIVNNDYVDAITGLRFVEDVRGNYHLVPISSGGNTTNNYTEVHHHHEHHETDSQLIILQTNIQSFTWSSVSNFNRINNTYSPNSFLAFTVPFGKEFRLFRIIAVQSRGTNTMNDQSILGLFNSGNLVMAMPFSSPLDLDLDNTLKFGQASFVEFKFKPHNNKLDLSVLALGHLLEGEQDESS